ncbi:MAG TPA: LacI family DNA-binding transcriptional regulator [Acidimicrobiales bacterium]|nr:LacI family DNA-binding transcriptional regulator [Acidimicrobiales bacterium]
MPEVTLKDVASRAGVSIATVGRVLHQNGYVSPSTKRRVDKAIRDTGYRLNAVAQGLRRKRTITMGLVLHGIMPNPFFAEVAMGAENAAVEQGFKVLIFNARGEASRERDGVETFLTQRVDAIIFTAALQRDSVQAALDAGISVVEIGRQLCESSGSVVADNYQGATRAMAYLLELGHERIGYIGEPYTFLSASGDAQVDRIVAERFDAYRDSLSGAGLALNEDYIVLGAYPRERGGWGSVETGARYMAQLLKQSCELTAVFTASDLLAAGALQTLYEQEVRVPRDISLVGFDDTYARHLAPPLTTVRQPMFEMGLRAASLAIDLITDGTPLPRTERCATELVVRESTAAPIGSRGSPYPRRLDYQREGVRPS